jgi:hypothetical protein
MMSSLVFLSVVPALQAQAETVAEREPCSLTVTVDARSIADGESLVSIRYDREAEAWTVLDDDGQPDEESDVTRPAPQDHYADLMELIRKGGEPRVEETGEAITLVYDELPEGTLTMDDRDLSDVGRARIRVAGTSEEPVLMGYTYELKEAFRIPMIARLSRYETEITFRDEPGYGPVPAASVNRFSVKVLGKEDEGEVDVTYSDYQCPVV